MRIANSTMKVLAYPMKMVANLPKNIIAAYAFELHLQNKAAKEIRFFYLNEIAINIQLFTN